MKHTNYDWTNFAWFSLLNRKMLSLWLVGLGATLRTNHKLPIPRFGNGNHAKTIHMFYTKNRWKYFILLIHASFVF
jgi:hypothetical protein